MPMGASSPRMVPASGVARLDPDQARTETKRPGSDPGPCNSSSAWGHPSTSLRLVPLLRFAGEDGHCGLLRRFGRGLFLDLLLAGLLVDDLHREPDLAALVEAQELHPDL